MYLSSDPQVGIIYRFYAWGRFFWDRFPSLQSLCDTNLHGKEAPTDTYNILYG